MNNPAYSWREWPQTQALVAAFADRPMRFVGGCVRDGLLGRSVTDVDVATPLPPQQVQELLVKAGHKAVPTGIEHGTMTAVIGGKGFEITTLRSDTHCDGRHAEVTFTDDWKTDAQRRDFTMNALYLSPQGELFDYFGGREDALAGRIRFIGDAAERIREDYLRILRFFRFFAHYGAGAPDAQALAACAQHTAQIKTLSGERLQHEMFKLLAAKRAPQVLALMHKAGVLQEALGVPLTPEPAAALAHTGLVPSPDAILTLAAMLRATTDASAQAEAIAHRLRFSTARRKRLAQLATLPALTRTISHAEQKQQIRRLGKDDFCDLARLSAAQTLGVTQAFRAMIELAETWEIPVFPVKGADLLALGVAEGAAVGQALKKLEEQWETSGYRLSREELLKNITLN